MESLFRNWNGVIFLLMSALSIGCGTRESGMSNKVKFQPIVHKTYSFFVHSETEVVQEINNNKQANVNKVEYNFSYAFTDGSNKNRIITMVSENFSLETMSNSQSINLNADSAILSAIPAERIFGALKDARFTFVVDSLGKVQSVSGVQELRNKMKELAKGNAEALEMINNSVKSYLNEEIFKQIAAGCVAPFVGDSIARGKKWADSSVVQGPVNMPVNIQYEVESLDSASATVNQRADINFADQQVEVDQQKVTASFSGSQEGKTEIDTETGLVINSQAQLQLKGTISLMGVKVPVEITTNTSVKRLN